MINGFTIICKEYLDFKGYCKSHKLYLPCARFYTFDFAYKRELNKVKSQMLKYFASSEDIINTQEDIKELYRNLTTGTLEDFLNTVIMYNDFLKYLTRSYLYSTRNNLDFSKDETGIIIKKENITIEYSFEDSEILQLGIDLPTDPLENFIENGVRGKMNSTVTFCNIHVTTKHLDEDIKLILGEEPNLNEEDTMMLDNIKKITSEAIRYDFYDILDCRLDYLNNIFKFYINDILGADIKWI